MTWHLAVTIFKILLLKNICLKDFPFMFRLFWHRIFCLIYLKLGDQEDEPEIAGRGADNWRIDIDHSVLKLTILQWIHVYSFDLKPTNSPNWWIWRSQVQRKLSQNKLCFCRCKNYFILLTPETWEYEWFIRSVQLDSKMNQPKTLEWDSSQFSSRTSFASHYQTW